MKCNRKEIILAVDSSTSLLSVGVYKQGKIFCIQKFSQDHSENLTKYLDMLLKKTKSKLTDIKNIVVNIGPGSFTGLRIGLSFVKTLAMFLNIKNIITTTSFDILLFEFIENYDIKNEDCKIYTLFPSVKNEFYLNCYVLKNGKIKKEDIVKYMKKEEIEKIFSAKKEKFYVVYSHKLMSSINIDKSIVKKLSFSAQTMINLFVKSYKKLYKIVPLNKLFPLYIRHTYY